MKNSELFASHEPEALQDRATVDLDRNGESNRAGAYVYRFGEFALDSRKRTLSRGDSPVSLTAKAFDVLLFLAQNPNRLVMKEELLNAVWGNTFVEEGNLTQYISLLRKALGDTSEADRLIVTIPRKGYQFTANVSVVEAADTARRAPVQVPTAESLQANTFSGHELPASAAVRKASLRWWKAALALGSLVIVVGGAIGLGGSGP